MTKITDNCYVDVEGWTREEVKKAAEILAAGLNCRVGDLTVGDIYHYLVADPYGLVQTVGKGVVNGFGRYTELTKEQVFACENVEESNEWGGKGLPPVGTYCEAFMANWIRPDYIVGTVIGYTKDLDIAAFEEDGGYVTWVHMPKDSLIPLETDEEIEKECMIDLVREAFLASEEVEGVDGTYRSTAKYVYEYLYEKGLRITDK